VEEVNHRPGVKVISSALRGVLSDIAGMWQRYSPVLNHHIHAFVFILIVAFASHAIDVQVTAIGGLSGPNCGSTVGDACGSLSDAWSACQSSSSGPCNMYLQPGHYVGPYNTGLYFGSAVISIVGVDKSGNTILDGEGSHSGFSSTGSITLDGLVLQNCINSALAWAPTVSQSLLEVSNCTFAGNQGSSGGALWLQPTASIIKAVLNASFIGNVANGYGGAIYAAAAGVSSHFTLSIGDYATFVNNIAAVSGDGYGGAIYAFAYGQDSTFTLSIGDNTSFVSNIAAVSGYGHGGAIYDKAHGQHSTSTLSIGDNAQFVNNVATGSSIGYGGAIYDRAHGQDSTSTLSIGDNAQFVSNTAAGSGYGYGGAIYAFAVASPSTSTLSIGDNAQFVNNVATGSGYGYGGAIYDSAHGQDSTSTLSIGDNAQFVNNTAAVSGYGGGGGIYDRAHGQDSTSTLSIGDNAQFVNNTAAVSGDGGAIYAFAVAPSSTSTLSIGDNAQFVNNTAAVSGYGDGGAIYASPNGERSTSTLSIGASATFVNNTAAVDGVGYGGAMFAEASGRDTTSTLSIGDDAAFVNNRASVSGVGYGGAIYVQSYAYHAISNLEIGCNARFVSNRAAESAKKVGRGGAIYAEASIPPSFITLTIGCNVNFVNNIAAVSGDSYGGAIFTYVIARYSNISLTIGDNAQFVSNRAAVSGMGHGGAISAEVSASSAAIFLMIGDNAQFTNNTAIAARNQAGQGGAIYAISEVGTSLHLSIGANASFLHNYADEGGIGFLSASSSNNFAISFGGNTTYSHGETGFRIAVTKSQGSFCIGSNSLIGNFKSFLFASLFQQSTFLMSISETTYVNCENCITTESFDSSAMQLTVVNSTFTGIVHYAISVLGVSAGKQQDNGYFNIINSSFVGTSGASAILGTTSNAGNISIAAVDSNFTSFSSPSDGGAIQVIAVAESTLSVDVINCRFDDTAALDGTNGGGIASTCFSSTCSLNISNSSFQNANATLGGAVAMLDDGGSTCTMSITNSSFNDCLATSGGGAIYSKRVKALNVTSTSFVSNKAVAGDIKASGGAIFTTGPSSLNIISCNFNGNSASSGGAIAISDFVNSVLDATSFSSNRAITGNGGAIALTDEGNHITVRDECILNGNYAKQSGGAVYVSGDSDGKRSLAHFLGVSCQENSATMGGCIFTDEYTNLTLDTAFSAAENHAHYGGDVAATDMIESSAKLSSAPKYDAPYCLKLPTQSIEVSPGIDASGQFTFEIIDVHGTTVEKVDSSFLVQITSEDGAVTVAGGSKTVDLDTIPKGGKIAFDNTAFTSTSLQPTVAKFGVTPPFSPQCRDIPQLKVHFRACPATYYLNDGTCVLCPDGEYQLNNGSSKCDQCGFGGTCLNGTMSATPGYWCETQDVNIAGMKKKSCDKESRLYKCTGPGCLGGDTSKEPDDLSFAVSCDEDKGYTGVLCAECKDGYVARDNKCVNCSLNVFAILDALVALALIIVLVYYTLLNAGGSNALLALTLFYFQNLILLPVSFEGITLGLLGTILDKFSISHAVLIPVSMGLSLVTFSGVVLSLGLPPIVRLLRGIDFTTFSWQQLALAGILGNISLATLCISVAIAISFLPHNARLIVLVLLILILLPVLILVIVFFISLSIMISLRRSLPFANLKGISTVAVSALGSVITIFCSLLVAVFDLGIVDEIKNIPLLEPALQLSFPFLTFVLPVSANLNISAALLELTQTCATPWNYYVRLLVGLFNPVLLLTILWLAYPGSLLVNWGLGFLSEKTHPAVGKMREYIHERIELKKFTIASLELLLNSFTHYLAVAVGFFACRYVKDKGWFLNQENSVECYSWEHNPIWVLLAPLSFIGVIYAVLLLPTVYLGILTITRFRKEWLQGKWRIGYDDSKRPLVAFFEFMHWIAETFQFQLASTQPYTFYWPVTIVLRRIFIVVVYVWLVEGDLQIAGAVILAMFYHMFVPIGVAVNPFALKTLNLLEAITLIFLGVCAMLYVLVDMSLLYTDTNDDIYYRGITDVIHFLFWPVASIPILVAVAIWVINQLPEKKKVEENGKETSEDHVDDKNSSTLGLSLGMEHSDPLMEALLTSGNDDEDNYL
jgi:predicted outer membrane repeat protein